MEATTHIKAVQGHAEYNLSHITKDPAGNNDPQSNNAHITVGYT